MSKKKVLFVTESHKLASGFGTYSAQVLPRLAATGKYELAEFASYGDFNTVNELDWLFYANVPDREEEAGRYNENPANHFGLWRFDKVVLDFKPDIVLSYRDPWMDDWIAHSPLRPYFHWVWMPTVDSAPQKRSWLETFATCDALFAYSEFGQRTLEEQSNNSLNVVGCASPALDPDVYKPVPSKSQHKESFGLPADCFIVGTVMRNQRRKLFIELMKSFKIFLDKAPPHIADKTYLYLHTSYPEKSGWDIAEGIMEHGLGSKVLVTYVCRNCSSFHASPFKDALAVCKNCNARAAVMPSVAVGLTIPDLIKIYNLFDLYVQYAICEGFGMPQVEAASCGVPIASTDYSAMEDVVRFTKGYPIRIKTMFRELETDAERAYPDNEHLAEIILKHFSLPEKDRLQKCLNARKGARERYNWNDTAKKWADYIDTYSPVGKQGLWDSPPNIPNPPPPIPEIADPYELVRFAYSNVLQEPEGVLSYEAQRFAQSLAFGAMIESGGLDNFDRETFWNIMNARLQSKTIVERIRCGMLDLTPERFLEEAHKRKKQ